MDSKIESEFKLFTFRKEMLIYTSYKLFLWWCNELLVFIFMCWNTCCSFPGSVFILTPTLLSQLTEDCTTRTFLWFRSPSACQVRVQHAYAQQTFSRTGSSYWQFKQFVHMSRTRACVNSHRTQRVSVAELIFLSHDGNTRGSTFGTARASQEYSSQEHKNKNGTR